MIIYLIRHGESTSDVKKQYAGDYDDHLTENGIADAKKIAGKLLSKSIQIIFSSPKIRGRETADIVRKELKCQAIIKEDLSEQDIYGAYTELGKNQPEEEYRRLGELLINQDNVIEGSETYSHFKNRIVGCFFEIVNSNYKYIAIITHGGPIRCIFREILKLGELKKIGNGSIIALEKNDLNFKVVEMDDAVS
ncbi:MAG: hypothetical protein ACD_15C00121G0001 [uncultured bacterium]|nr:MAG: hypothetical protein ACD_15C00121G0001 [uncultured bacterium]KKT88272.1 MAG: phosphoglycerate mutase [Candidatus Moranbacteria bacterium GW2011_GWC2_45_10]KKT92690.1 MAG: phosphoglycerate mutase, phosphoglycerate mutase [Parcubacteria group bacterium GW2011_GWC1_45_14]HAV11545.1 hypothetical protein [Candidatus Moranbacteria bacterium]